MALGIELIIQWIAPVFIQQIHIAALAQFTKMIQDLMFQNAK